MSELTKLGKLFVDLNTSIHYASHNADYGDLESCRIALEESQYKIKEILSILPLIVKLD